MGIPYSMFAKKSDVSSNGFITNFLEKDELSREVHVLLEQIKNNSPTAYANLMQQLHNISDKNANKENIVYIQAHHFNTVVRLLFLQRSLSADILVHVNTYLENVKPESVQIIQNLRVKYLPKISTQARKNNLAHHSLDHGVELKVRSMQVITQDLEMYNTSSDYDVFMRNVLSFAFECHDYFQGKPEIGYATVEEQTAEYVINWLTGADGFPNLSPEVSSWIRYQIVYMIPVATTVAFSSKCPMHLTRLLGIFEAACQQANITLNHASNTINCLNSRVIAHVVGCFDTIAYTMRSAVKRQVNSELLKTELYLNRFYALKFAAGSDVEPLSLLKQIMITEEMQPYYLDESLDINFQAFTKSLVPKFGMTIEFANKHSDASIREKSLLTGNFVREMKTMYSNIQNLDFILEKFDKLFDERDIGRAVEDVFLREENIIVESKFSMSNLGRVCLANKVLGYYFDMNKKISGLDSDTFDKSKKEDTIIAPRAVEADANNIVKLLQGYKKLSVDLKRHVLKEIVLNLVIQAGRNYLKNPALEDCLDVTPRRLPTTSTKGNDFSSKKFPLSVSAITDDVSSSVNIANF